MKVEIISKKKDEIKFPCLMVSYLGNVILCTGKNMHGICGIETLIGTLLKKPCESDHAIGHTSNSWSAGLQTI